MEADGANELSVLSVRIDMSSYVLLSVENFVAVFESAFILYLYTFLVFLFNFPAFVRLFLIITEVLYLIHWVSRNRIFTNGWWVILWSIDILGQKWWCHWIFKLIPRFYYYLLFINFLYRAWLHNDRFSWNKIWFVFKNCF